MNRIARATSLIEYAFLMFAVAIAFIGMSVYLKRAVSGKAKQSADVFGFGRQYQQGKTAE